MKVIPLSTELPIRAKASRALSIRDGNGLILNALATWAQNSTDIPIHMMRLTKETAFNEILQTYIRPSKLTTIMAITTVIIMAIPRLNPSKMNVTAKIAPTERAKLVNNENVFKKYINTLFRIFHFISVILFQIRTVALQPELISKAPFS